MVQPRYLLTSYPLPHARFTIYLQVEVQDGVIDVALDVIGPGDGRLAAHDVQELVEEDDVAVRDLHAVEGLLQAAGGHAVGARVDDVLEVKEADTPTRSTALEG